MSERVGTPLLELHVGRFRLALRTSCVLSVLQDVHAGPKLAWHGETLLCADLRLVFAAGQPPSSTLPYAVAFEDAGRRVVAGVDAVRHIRSQSDTVLVQVPSFGLLRPDLFEGALRTPEHLSLLLRPAVLADLLLAGAGRSII